MYLKQIIILLGIFYCVFGNGVAVSWADPKADKIVAQADKVFIRRSFENEALFQIKRDGEVKNEYTTRSYHKGRDKMLMRFLTPPRVKNQAILKNGDDQWLYFPNLKKAMKISGRQQLFGSDFSYGDILNVDLQAEYTAEILSSNVKEAGFKCYKLELKARAPTSTYAKIIYYIRKSDYAAIRREFYTKSGKLFKVLVFAEHNQQKIPMRWTMSSVLSEGDTTVMLIKKFIPRDIPNLYFSLGYLRRGY